MKILFATSEQQQGQLAGDIIATQIQQKPDTLLGLATGGSPVATYQYLQQLCAKGQVNFSRVKTVNLDEYVGISPEQEQSYLYFMKHQFFDHINIDKANCNIPNGLASDLQTECARYDQVIRNYGGVDLQLLGIGHDGHIGFNEPCDHFSEGTNCVKLTPMTREANQRYFDKLEDVPTHALTMGIYDIMMAKKIVMVVSGADKSDILAEMLHGPVTPQVPASILKFHPDCTLIIEESASGMLK